MELTAIDLFAGAGGATRGLKDAGYQVLAAIEIDQAAAKTFAANHSDTKLVIRDVREVSTEDLMSELKLVYNKLTLLKACPPCQGYSSLGTTDPDDARNDLVAEVWRFTRALRPKAVTVENVPGLARDARLSLLTRQMRAIGYRVRTHMLEATNFGVPQRRRRLILLAIKSELAKEMPDDLIELLPRSFRERKTAGEVIAQAGPLDGSDPVHRHRNHTKTVIDRIRAIPTGGTRFDLPEEHRLECHRRLSSRRACASYGRIKEDEPAPTLTTRCTTPACGSFIHPREHRGLTLREAALLQTFPIDYSFCGHYGDIEAQIGNALPVRMAEGIGHIVQNLLGKEGPI